MDIKTPRQLIDSVCLAIHEGRTNLHDLSDIQHQLLRLEKIDGELTNKKLNEILKALPSDADRLEAMENICKCGNVIAKDSRCWSCYDSRGDRD